MNMNISDTIRSFLTPTQQLPKTVSGLSAEANRTAGTPTQTLRVAVDLAEQSLSIFASLAREQVYKIVRLTGTEAGVQKVHELVTSNAEAIFWTFALVNLWQNWMCFCIGTATGLAVGTFGTRLGIITESVQILKTQDSVAGYNYLSTSMIAVLAPWLTSFQGGLVAANYLLHPSIGESETRTHPELEATDNAVEKKKEAVKGKALAKPEESTSTLHDGVPPAPEQIDIALLTSDNVASIESN